MEKREEKLIIAVLQADDYEGTISSLNKAGFFVTVLSSIGGFLRKRSMTIMVGVEENCVEEVLRILQERAGKRTEIMYQNVGLGHEHGVFSEPVASMTKVLGGTTVFVLSIEAFHKF